MAQAVTEYDDIQAIVRYGFSKLEESCFLLARITDLDEARAWLGAVAGKKDAGELSYQLSHLQEFESCREQGLRMEQAVQVAFTAQGLLKLGVPPQLFPDDRFEGEPDRLHLFSREFYLGMTGKKPRLGGDRDEDIAQQSDPEHSLLLGDIGENAPSNWEWGNPDRLHQMPDVLIMLYAEEGMLAGFRQTVMADLACGFEVFRVLHAANAAHDQKLRREPFGFPDGISQPQIDWEARRKPGTRPELEYTNLIAAGEFLLGYPNEYGQYTYRPLLDPEQDPHNLLAPAQDQQGKRDLARNGTYLVFRELEQDVSGFWRFVAKNSQDPEDDGVRLAECMVGRRLSTGDPLVVASQAGILGVGPEADDIKLNGFTFDADPEGFACPFGAHIRRANPRTADLPGGRQGLFSRLLRMLGLKHGGPREDLLSSSRFHRIIRRGRPYGPLIGRESALKDEDPGVKTGIYFIALNANISRQFEFIQNAWLVNSKFNALDGESDPLLGNREASPWGQPTDGFSLPHPSGRNWRIEGLPQFIRMRGGAYFFLPGLRAVRYLAQLGKPADKE